MDVCRCLRACLCMQAVVCGLGKYKLPSHILPAPLKVLSPSGERTVKRLFDTVLDEGNLVSYNINNLFFQFSFLLFYHLHVSK